MSDQTTQPPADPNPLLSVPIGQLTVAQLLSLKILGTDEDKVPDSVNQEAYAVRLKKADLVALADLLVLKLQASLAASSPAVATPSASARPRKPAAKKAPSKKAVTKKAPAKRPAKQGRARKSAAAR